MIWEGVVSATLFYYKTKTGFLGLISMIILKELGTDQTFKIIPRSYTMDSMVIRLEGAEESGTTYAVTGTRVDYDGNPDSEGTYLSITDTVALTEGNYYSLTVKNGSTVIYKDKIFCTNQTISSFSVNNGQYTEQSSNSDFIFI